MGWPWWVTVGHSCVTALERCLDTLWDLRFKVDLQGTHERGLRLCQAQLTELHRGSGDNIWLVGLISCLLEPWGFYWDPSARGGSKLIETVVPV